MAACPADVLNEKIPYLGGKQGQPFGRQRPYIRRGVDGFENAHWISLSFFICTNIYHGTSKIKDKTQKHEKTVFGAASMNYI